MQKVSMKARQEVIEKHRLKYHRASKKEKTEILNYVSEATGLSRDRVTRLLGSKAVKRSKKGRNKRGRKPKYGKEEIDVLTKVWYFMDNACGKRMVAGMKTMLDALIRHKEISISDDVQEKLCHMSASTIDRLLAKERQKYNLKGKSTTKPGTLLKKNIPIRMGTEWDENQPGYVEIDLVAHCGATTAGEYVNTLDVTDVFTGWTETQATINKAQVHVFKALKDIKERMPFKILGIDSDNGSEFINYDLFKYCKQEEIVFTRSRPNRKNDGCHVEQKNWSLVRRNIGYSRFEGGIAVVALNEYYQILRLYTNFFLPHMKLIEKTREGATVKKIYDDAKTPYQRLLDSSILSNAETAELNSLFLSLNPADLKRSMVKQLSVLERVAF